MVPIVVFPQERLVHYNFAKEGNLLINCLKYNYERTFLVLSVMGA